MDEEEAELKSENPHRLEYQNAQERINQQIETVREFSRDAYQTLRITFIIAGLLVTALSYLGGDVNTTVFSRNCAVDLMFTCMPIRFIFNIAILFLFSSVVINIPNSGVEARGLGKICEVTDLRDQIGKNRTETEYLQERLRRYKIRIEDNDELISFLETSLAWGKATLAMSLLSLLIVAYTLATGQHFGPVISYSVVAFSVLIPRILENQMPERYIEAESTGIPAFR